MKHGYLAVVASLLLATGLITGCGSITGGSPPNIYAGAVFISDRETAGTYELFINDNATNVISKMSGALDTGGNVQSFKIQPSKIGFIAYLADQDNAGINELYYIKESVGDAVKVNADLTTVGQSVTSYEWSPDGLLMAYIVKDGAVSELYVSDAKTNNKVSPTSISGSGVVDFKWSPDSQHIAFSSTVAGGAVELHVSNVDGTVIATQISNSLSIPTSVDYEWSPDSAFIAYVSDQLSATADLFTISTDYMNDSVTAQANTVVVTDSSVTGSVQAFRWPNASSTQLAYTAPLLSSGYVNLFTSSSSSNSSVFALSSVTAGGGVNNDFLWAPNNSYLAYVADQAVVGEFELYIAAPGIASAGEKVSAAAPTGDVDTTDGFVWSLFSNQIIYRANQSDASKFELYVTTIESGASTGIEKISGDSAETPNAVTVGERFLLSPFGNVLSYTAEENAGQSELFVTTLVDNSGIVKLSGATMVANGDVYQHDWSSDGTKVFYVADQDTDGTYDVYTTVTSDLTNTNLSSSPAATTGILNGAFVDSFGVSETLFPL